VAPPTWYGPATAWISAPAFSRGLSGPGHLGPGFSYGLAPRNVAATALRDHVGQRHAIQHVGNRVANLRHHQAHATGFDIAAVPARLIGRAARTGDRRQRPVDGTDHLTYLDLARYPREPIAATGPLLALHNTGVAQFSENSVEKFLRYGVRFGDVDRLGRRLRIERSNNAAVSLALNGGLIVRRIFGPMFLPDIENN